MKIQWWYESKGGVRTPLRHLPFLYTRKFLFIHSSQEWNGGAFQWINTVCETRSGIISNSTTLILAFSIRPIGKRITEQSQIWHLLVRFSLLYCPFSNRSNSKGRNECCGIGGDAWSSFTNCVNPLKCIAILILENFEWIEIFLCREMVDVIKVS